MNKNKIYIHDQNSISTINKKYLFSLIPLIIFGFYKNGLIVFQNNYTNIFGFLKPLFIPLIGFGIGYLVAKIINKYKYNKTGSILNNYLFPIQTMIVGMLMPIRINIIVFMIALLLISIIYFTFFYKLKFNFNFIILTTVIIILIAYLTSGFSNVSSLFMNPYEEAVLLNHSLYRLLFGYSSAGISTSSVVLVMLGYIIMSFSLSYKKEISFYLFTMFGIVFLLSVLFGSSFSDLIRAVLNSSFIFIITFVANDSKSTPYTKLSMFVYSFLIVVLTLLISIINFDIALYFAILIVSFLTPLLNKVFKKTKF